MIILVAAMTRSHVIGKGNLIPWKIREEGMHYQRIVEGKTIIVGRSTFETLGKSNPAGHTIVLSREANDIPGADVCSDLTDAIKLSRKYGNDVYVIGGASVFQQAISVADRMCLSFIKKEYGGDKFFPQFNEEDWKVESREDFADFEYVVYARRR